MHTEHNFYTGLIENISEGGLFIATYENIQKGTELDIDLSLPNQPSIKAQGIVRWIREYNEFTADVSPGVGVQFVDLRESDQAIINGFLQIRAPLLYESL
jgi:uncharacterized protein (TIGR02266 family)